MSLSQETMRGQTTCVLDSGELKIRTSALIPQATPVRWKTVETGITRQKSRPLEESNEVGQRQRQGHWEVGGSVSPAAPTHVFPTKRFIQLLQMLWDSIYQPWRQDRGAKPCRHLTQGHVPGGNGHRMPGSGAASYSTAESACWARMTVPTNAA